MDVEVVIDILQVKCWKEVWKCLFYDETFFLYQKDDTRNVAVKACTQKL